MSMDPTIKAQWVAALRSGEYHQGEGALYSKADNQYCCLGVLCDLAEKAGVVTRSESMNYPSSNDPATPGQIVTRWGTMHPKDDVLPVEVIDWCGISGENPEVEIVRTCDDVDCDNYDCNGEHEDWKDLADLNDSGTYFSELASLIEDQL